MNHLLNPPFENTTLRLITLVLVAFHVPVIWADDRVQSAEPVTAAPVSDQMDDEMDDIELLELDIPVVVTAARREQKITAVPHALASIGTIPKSSSPGKSSAWHWR